MTHPTTSDCIRPCMYLDKQGICNYMLVTGNRRPCPCGPDFTVRVDEEKSLKQFYYDNPSRVKRAEYHPSWDTEKGKRMWLQGIRVIDIAEEVGVTKGTINRYAAKHWPPREKPIRKPNKTRWDVDAAFLMFMQGKTYPQISKALSTPASTIRNYSSRHNWEECKRVTEEIILGSCENETGDGSGED